MNDPLYHDAWLSSHRTGMHWGCYMTPDAAETGDCEVVQASAEAVALLREVAQDWEPGPGPFEVPLSVVNRVVNYLARQSIA